MSSRMARHDDGDARRDASPRMKRRRFTEVPEPRTHDSSRHREPERGAHFSRDLRRRSRSRSPISRRDRMDTTARTERRYRETPPREKQKFKEERENDVPRKRKKSPSLNREPGREAVSEEGSYMGRRYDQTEFLLNDRFSALSTSRQLVVEENVSVEIERKISGRESFKIPKVLDPRAVVIPKSALEGRGPITSRDEFRGKGTDFPANSWYPDNRLGGRNLEKRVVQPVVTDEGLGEGQPRERRFRENWNGSPAKDYNRYNDQHDARQRVAEDGSNLPDFSKRPGRYMYEAWKDRPEMIPKGKSYYEHDLREKLDNDLRRARSDRGGHWSRGRVPRGRGSYGRQMSRPDMDTWKHDKFEELLAEESQEAM